MDMKTIEFQTELEGNKKLKLPPEIASSLPKKGKAKVIIYPNPDPEDETWKHAAYEQFLREDTEEDSVYDKYS